MPKSSNVISPRKWADRLLKAGFSQAEVIGFLCSALDAHKEIMDDYETYLAEHFNTPKDAVHLTIAMGPDWVADRSTTSSPLIKKYQDRVVKV